MGKPSPTETVRNEKLYNEWKNSRAEWGLLTKLANKFGISRQRASQIINREKLLEVIPSLESEDTI